MKIKIKKMKSSWIIFALYFLAGLLIELYMPDVWISLGKFTQVSGIP